MTTTRSVTAATWIRAERVEISPSAHGRLGDADYADAFRVAADGFHPAEQWARSAFEGPSSRQRRLFALAAWRGLLGLRLGPPDSPDHVAGWAIVVNEPGTVVLRTDSWLIDARLVIDGSKSETTMTTLVRYQRRAGHVVWAMAGILHRRLAPRVLVRAARSLARQG
ncbi:MAG: DUF2867 domain-containing protein [Geodermatophilaceae bacterium]